MMVLKKNDANAEQTESMVDDDVEMNDVSVGTKTCKFKLPVMDVPVRVLGSVRVLAHARTGTGICI